MANVDDFTNIHRAVDYLLKDVDPQDCHDFDAWVEAGRPEREETPKKKSPRNVTPLQKALGDGVPTLPSSGDTTPDAQ